jgi:hypothetical protein
MRHHSTLLAVVVALLTVPLMGTQCTATSICDKSAVCQEEENDRSFSDDAVAVCAVEYETSINALYANEEDECHRLADAILALDRCKAGLKCDDFVEADLGGECDDERDELDDARDDVDGFECSAQE